MGDKIPYTLNHFDKNTSIDCKTLGKMMTKTCWMKKSLKPNTTLKNHIDQIYDTQKNVDKGTMDEKIPNN